MGTKTESGQSVGRRRYFRTVKAMPRYIWVIQSSPGLRDDQTINKFNWNDWKKSILYGVPDWRQSKTKHQIIPYCTSRLKLWVGHSRRIYMPAINDLRSFSTKLYIRTRNIPVYSLYQKKRVKIKLVYRSETNNGHDNGIWFVVIDTVSPGSIYEKISKKITSPVINAFKQSINGIILHLLNLWTCSSMWSQKICIPGRFPSSVIPGDHNPQASRSYEGNMNAQEFGIDNHVFMFRARIHLDSLLVSVVHCPYFTNSDLPPWQSGTLFFGHFGDVSF